MGVGARCQQNAGECRQMPGECKGVGVMWQGNAGIYLGDVWMLVIGGRGKQGNTRRILGKHRFACKVPGKSMGMHGTGC